MIEDLDECVEHWCPKKGQRLLIDIDRSKSCLYCKFAVYKLICKRPRFVQYVFLGHLFTGIFFVYYLIYQDSFLFSIAVSFLIFDLAYFVIAQHMILSRKHDCLLAKIQELRNWSFRSHH